MQGVILFVDDHIFDSHRLENELFHKFNSDGTFSVLPINNLKILEKTIRSISTFKALILDWNFEREKESDETDFILPDETSYNFLKASKIYSLVYVYSQNDISTDIKNELESLYPGKIFFERKDSSNDVGLEFDKISLGIKDFEEKNKHLSVPFVWSQAINQSAQAIFTELEQADPNWIKDIYLTAKEDGGDPNSEVIQVFQNLLNESIIQNEQLIEGLKISASLNEISDENKEKSLAQLYNRIYYTKLVDNAPLMTGDIFKFTNEEYAILFTPECDINNKKETNLDFFVFNKNKFDEYLKKREYEKIDYETLKSNSFKTDELGNKVLKGKLKDLVKEFNNGNIKVHILPSFPFEADKHNLSALIDFETSLMVKSKVEFENKRSDFKLNSPYIYQLRQRYLAYIGRVGVPSIPQSLRFFNLK
ncbi:hypothetical protein [Aquirufa nivalisilvae]|uniref:hypothetical protein n=1 Tax=Aquirufa nivalisilvae TaxID=2516557 RepID=UPI001032CBDD|nr:hypothetical protein [Aquirufa nivalisilvae]TBH72313.1 hypothetical protein EWU22_11045 [Aquirufa nivalisilvae]